MKGLVSAACLLGTTVAILTQVPLPCGVQCDLELCTTADGVQKACLKNFEVVSLEKRASNDTDSSIIDLTTTATATENATATTTTVLTTTVTEISTVIATSTAPAKPAYTVCGWLAARRYLECAPGQICIGDKWGHSPEDGAPGTCVSPDGPKCLSHWDCDHPKHGLDDLVCAGAMKDGCTLGTKVGMCYGRCAHRDGKPYYTIRS